EGSRITGGPFTHCPAASQRGETLVLMPHSGESAKTQLGSVRGATLPPAPAVLRPPERRACDDLLFMEAHAAVAAVGPVSRRDNAARRCLRCRMLGDLCICDLLPRPRLELRTRLVLFIHRYEDRKPTNTGRLAAECLARSEVIVRGHESQPTPPFAFDPDTQPL